jgi:hypothetical protein
MAGTILVESEVLRAVELILAEGASLCLLAFGAKLAPLPLLRIEEDAFVELDEKNAPGSISNNRFVYDRKRLEQNTKKRQNSKICNNPYVD